MRVGMGYDVHRLVEDRKLIIGGVEIPYEKGLLGHSDADVLLHAIMDALLGAAALGDIGKHFPDTLKLDIDRVNVKATTEEGLGFTGTGEGISSQAICSLNDVTNYIYGDSDMTNCCGGCGGCSVK